MPADPRLLRVEQEEETVNLPHLLLEAPHHLPQKVAVPALRVAKTAQIDAAQQWAAPSPRQSCGRIVCEAAPNEVPNRSVPKQEFSVAPLPTPVAPSTQTVGGELPVIRGFRTGELPSQPTEPRISPAGLEPKHVIHL